MGLTTKYKREKSKQAAYVWDAVAHGDRNRRAADMTVAEMFAAFALAGMTANENCNSMKYEEVVGCAMTLGEAMAAFYGKPTP